MRIYPSSLVVLFANAVLAVQFDGAAPRTKELAAVSPLPSFVSAPNWKNRPRKHASGCGPVKKRPRRRPWDVTSI